MSLRPLTVSLQRATLRLNSAASLVVVIQTTRHSYSSSSNKPAPFPTVETCPSPTCACSAPPEMPKGMEIDRDKPLNGLISKYNQHVLVCTGKDDWPSRIEEDNSGDNLAADLKELFGRGGRFSDVRKSQRVLKVSETRHGDGIHADVLNSSFPSSVPSRTELHTTSAYLLPSFKYVPFLPRVSFEAVEALAKGYLLPEKLHPAHYVISPLHRDVLLRKPAFQSLLWGVRDVEDVLVLVCGHGGRDARCGIYGPLLRAEFETLMPEFGIDVLSGPVAVESEAPRLEEAGSTSTPAGDSEGGQEAGKGRSSRITGRVAVISHIGGHKFAGNVIIYLPPRLKDERGAPHPLAGHGVWYGRVEPTHVEGLIRETIKKGNVVKDLFRGCITPDSEILRL